MQYVVGAGEPEDMATSVGAASGKEEGNIHSGVLLFSRWSYDDVEVLQFFPLLSFKTWKRCYNSILLFFCIRKIAMSL